MTQDEGESRSDAEASRPSPGPADDEGDSDDFVTRLRTAETGVLAFVREAFVSVSIVVAIGLLLYLVSGVWPPMVAVESGSMEPHMERGDLVVISAPERFSPEYDFEETGVVTADVGEERGYRTLGGHGSVVVYDPPSRFGSPIIHRAHFWVEEGENWYDEANPEYVNADGCAELSNCPAPHAGFVTKGDANSQYDQASGIAEPVKREWVEGVARFRIPYLGYVRLKLTGLFVSVPAGDAPSVGESVLGYAGPPEFESDRETVAEKTLQSPNVANASG
ncbi:signal peptidase, endoplasmic reticulum-type [Halopelagius inordinatus]|uniref:Signal peptidase, endoplasmic reticulum-type n=1 Tax=Halopelagius inordinatus TaxID=553467 RepID=A0A1I2LA09_9EURY|nr:S26 family signal peptidase [Halopelagius inordinatus]SFF75289.1 signal peptidase, endoplasmic reticulum-type [Halopelagius inordinatus]